MKLFVDDIRNAPDESWLVARTITSAINALSKFEFDEISLDHDISHQVSVGESSRPHPCNECFCAVAQYVAINEWPREPKINIHTSNPIGAQDMAAILQNYKDVNFKLSKPANRLETLV